MKYTEKRRCGRLLPFGAVLAAALLLSGCSALPETGTVPGGEIVPLTGGTAQGCYAQGSDPEDGGESLTFWVDYTARSITCLCAQPNCDHTGDSCTARGGLPVVLPDGRLVWKDSRTEPDGSVSTALWLSRADGSDRRLLVERQPGTLLPRFADGTDLYYAALTNGGTMPGQLCRVPLDGGDPVTALELRNPGDGTGDEAILGVEGRCLVTEYADLSGVMAVPRPDPLTDDPQAEAEYQAALEQIVTRRQIWLTDLDTGEQNLLFQWECPGAERGWYGFWEQGTLYQVQEDGSTLRMVRPDGSMSEREILWPESLAEREPVVGAEETRLVGGRMLLTCYRGQGRVRAAVDPATGNAEEIRLQTAYQEGGSHPMQIAGYSGGYLLMQAEERLDTALTLGEDGSLQQTAEPAFGYALLREDDFLASRPDWISLEGAGGYLTSIWYW